MSKIPRWLINSSASIQIKINTYRNLSIPEEPAVLSVVFTVLYICLHKLQFIIKMQHSLHKNVNEYLLRAVIMSYD